jgi:hypothetical protein
MRGKRRGPGCHQRGKGQSSGVVVTARANQAMPMP